MFTFTKYNHTLQAVDALKKVAERASMTPEKKRTIDEENNNLTPKKSPEIKPAPSLKGIPKSLLTKVDLNIVLFCFQSSRCSSGACELVLASNKPLSHLRDQGRPLQMTGTRSREIGLNS